MTWVTVFTHFFARGNTPALQRSPGRMTWVTRFLYYRPTLETNLQRSPGRMTWVTRMSSVRQSQPGRTPSTEPRPDDLGDLAREQGIGELVTAFNGAQAG